MSQLLQTSFSFESPVSCIPKTGFHLQGKSGSFVFYIVPATQRASYFVTGLKKVSDGFIAEGTTKPIKKNEIEKALNRFPVDAQGIKWESVPGGKWNRNFWLNVIEVNHE